MEDEFQFSFKTQQELAKAIYNAIPKKLGDLGYWSDYASEVGKTMTRLIERINDEYDAKPEIKDLVDNFTKSLRVSINDGIGKDDAVSIAEQHVILEPIFAKVFPEFAIIQRDSVGRDLSNLYNKLLEKGLDSERGELKKFYDNVLSDYDASARARTDEERQKLIKNLYGTLFK